MLLKTTYSGDVNETALCWNTLPIGRIRVSHRLALLRSLAVRHTEKDESYENQTSDKSENTTLRSAGSD